MKIVVTGGGSGGHITPILAVASELKSLDKTINISYIGQKGDGLADIPAQDPHINAVYNISAGKFRRYHGEGLRQLLDLPTMYKNLRDAVRVTIGFFQSIRLLKKLRPNIIFTRGSFVSVPVCLAAALLKIPYITHDSDGIPSLANRIIARWAVAHAVALPEELYPYPRAKTVMTGIPIAGNYQPVTPAEQAGYRQQLGLAAFKQVILVTGGGHGAQRLNEAVVANAPALLKKYPELAILHVTGRAHEEAVRNDYVGLGAGTARIKVIGYTTELHAYSAAADVIIMRAGATSIAEFAVQGRACIVVPNPQLTGGHQTVNARVLAKDKAIIVLDEDQVRQEGRLAHAVTELLDDPQKRQALADRLRTFARPHAAQSLAMLLLDKAKK